MNKKGNTQRSSTNIIGGVAGLIIGLILVSAGGLILIHAAYMSWELYQNPEAIDGFAKSLSLFDVSRLEVDLNGLDPLRLIAWPFIVLVLLLQGKIGLWAIEGGARLLEACRQR
ncbi:MAG: hypothetical protein GY703_03285 [Gammaproteobacteria bacterium]|nr:hypothetical protein [Gammaproteobacteria bacterium]